MTKMPGSTTSAFPAPEFAAAIDRFRAIAAASGDRLLLGDGPPHPDAELLKLCAEALHLLIEAECASRDRPITTLPPGLLSRLLPTGLKTGGCFRCHRTAKHAPRRRSARSASSRRRRRRGSTRRRWWYRASRTGAQLLSMSLAQDLIVCPGLRAALWPAAGEAA